MKIKYTDDGLEGIEFIIEIIKNSDADLVELSIKYDTKRINSVCLTIEQYSELIGVLQYIESEIVK